MRAILEHERAVLLHGDAKDLGQALDENTIDAVVTDPPAGIEFMGKGWDSDRGGADAWSAWLAECLAPSFRALKPGGHILCWAIPRTSHWTARALELAGFEVRDVVHHIFGTGFPKSLTSKSADIPEGAGTALKPAVEHWILARKPLDGTYGENYEAHGTGVLNIDACRIAHASEDDRASATPQGKATSNADGGKRPDVEESGERVEFERPDTTKGRWPAHLTMDDGAWLGDAARFFYVAKAPRSEKDAGLEHLPQKTGGEATGRADGSAGTKNPRAGAGRTGGARNFHPTVKNLALMRWLVRLITPPGGTVLDPFAGSGSTGVAALAEGMSFVGVEQGGENDEYLPIFVGRIRHALGLPQEAP